MSKWTEFRDNIVDNLNIDNVTEEMKQNLTVWLIETALPLATTAAANFTTQLKTQASGETGWNKIRDLIVLPFIIQGGLWLVETALQKTASVKEA